MVGCGGYVYGSGVISSPDYDSLNVDSADYCTWFLEARQSESAILMKKIVSSNNGTRTSARYSIQINQLTVRELKLFKIKFPSNLFHSSIPIHGDIYHTKQVYDGWDTSGQVLYDNRYNGRVSFPQSENLLYSISTKMMIRIWAPRVTAHSKIVSWNISTVITISILLFKKRYRKNIAQHISVNITQQVRIF